MKWLARAGLVALMALLVSGGVVNVAALRSLPQLDGQLKLQGLGAEVKVTRDASDVTHIEAKVFLIRHQLCRRHHIHGAHFAMRAIDGREHLIDQG